jgi:hypothetical protein
VNFKIDSEIPKISKKSQRLSMEDSYKTSVKNNNRSLTEVLSERVKRMELRSKK